MNCDECRENLVAVREELASEATQRDVSRHLAACNECRLEEANMVDIHTRLLRDSRTSGGIDVAPRVAQRIEHASAKRRNSASRIFGWKSLAAAAAIIVGIILASQWEWSGPARAEAVLEKGAEAARAATTMHMRARMRTLPRDNFENIGVDYDFVALDLWKRGAGKDLQWRVEKPGRVAVMDGKALFVLLKPIEKGQDRFPGIAIKGPPGARLVDWLRGLLDVEDILLHEVKAAQKQPAGGSTLTLSQEKAPGGRKISVVTVEARAQGDFANDWCKNKSIVESDNRRVYRFDASSNRLESMQVWIHLPPKNDVLVFEASHIEYPGELPASLFALELPAGVQWQDVAALIPATAASAPAAIAPEKKPEEIARGFFEAFGRGDQQALDTYLGIKMALPMLEQFRNKNLTLTVVSVGKPFQSGRYPGWFVPYEVEFSDGTRKETKKHNLAVRNDNPARLWHVDGGF